MFDVNYHDLFGEMMNNKVVIVFLLGLISIIGDVLYIKYGDTQAIETQRLLAYIFLCSVILMGMAIFIQVDMWISPQIDRWITNSMRRLKDGNSSGSGPSK